MLTPSRATSGVISRDALCGGLNGNDPNGVIKSDIIRREGLDGGSVLLEVSFEL